uniref:Cadherin domain-containing protein n=1 Tax=Oreochromis aureus TaxID=47969 RepID=A0AAZ1XJM6_OREAU
KFYPESSAPGSRFPLESAQDLDVGSNSLRTYLLSVNEHFFLDIQTRSDGSKFAELVLQNPLDREQQSAHQMVLTAVDGGAPERSGTVQIDITVLDANDNAPVFDQSFYRVRLAENAPKGTVVIKLNASDLDEGSNADITYSFSGHAPIKVRQLFSVDSETGEIKVKGVIDYEKARMHEIYVQAKDKGPSAVAVHCKVLVNVLDKNDNLPEPVYAVNVSENSAAGTVVMTLNATDLDEGTNAQLVYSHTLYTSEKTQELFSLDPNSGEIKVKGVIDYEESQSFEMHIQAQDRGTNPLSGHCKVTVFVTDLNDNYPEVTIKSLKSSLTEDVAVGTLIAVVSVSDRDSGANGECTHILFSPGEQRNIFFVIPL